MTGLSDRRCKTLAFAVPFTTNWELIGAADAEAILANGHSLVQVIPWSAMTPVNKALRVDGQHPTDPDYPYRQTWSLSAAPGYEDAAKALAPALTEALAPLPTIRLAAVGDDHAIYAFTSRKRDFVRLDTVKAFDERLGGAVMRRISALKPGYYTRIGPAVRHVTRELIGRPNRHRLLLVLTDGKPNDIDHYEGRYGIEDTRVAVREARRAGVAVFGVTVDRQAQDYFPHIFGRGSYHIVAHAATLSSALPKIYRQLVA